MPDPENEGWSARGDFARILGKIESNTAQLGQEIRDLKGDGKARDQSLKGLEERVQKNAHKANNDLQALSGRVENVQVSVDTANKRMEQQGVQLTGIEKRVGDLERPVNEALEQRVRRRAKLRRYWMWMAGALIFLWGGFEPVYKTLMPLAVQRWFSINLPPH